MESEEGFDLMLNQPKWPFLMISLLPVRLHSDSFDYRLNNLAVSAGYHFKLKKSVNNINLMYNHQQGYNSINAQTIGCTTMNTIYSIQTSLPLTISLNYTWLQYRINDSNTTRQAYGAEISYFKKSFLANAGVRYNLNSHSENNLDGYFVIGYSIKRNLQLRIRVEKITYQNFLYPETGTTSYNKLNAMLTINYTW